MAASPYKLYGGATREDAITGLNPQFWQAMQALYAAAPPEVQAELALNSAYRSPETQQALWDKSDKSGKWVAAPGKSKHNHGTAADLYGFGLTHGKPVSDATKNWVHQNAAQFGLNFPMQHEPWHIQLTGEEKAEANAQMKAAGYTPEQRRNAIASIESAGSGDYAATGAWTGDPKDGRDRAYGRYQMMGNNIGPWAEQYLKQSGVTPDMLLKDPALQDKLFDAVYGDYVGKYGERGAASKWFTGSEKEPARTDVNGKLTGGTYADKYMAALGAAPAQHPTTTVGTGGYVKPGANTTPVPAAAAVAAKTPDKMDMYQEAASGALGAMANVKAPVLGSGGNAPKMQYQPPMAMEAAPIVTGGVGRDELAMLMQRLNSGRLG